MKLFLIIALFLGLAEADEVFYNFENFNLPQVKLSKKYCITSFKKSEKYCCETKLSYPDSAKISNFPYQESLKKEIKKALEDYKKNNIKVKTWVNLKDEIASTFFDYKEIHLFALTEIGYSLKFAGSSYSGGAHGNYYVGFKNFDKNGKEMKLSDIITDLKGFKKEALKIYKKQHNLKPNDPLTKDDWFDNEFILPKEFAVTNSGILFLYNPYEIKPYAAGVTKFFVPFNKVKNYLNSSLLAPLLKSKSKKSYYFIDESEGKIYLKLTLTQTGGNRFKVSTKIYNFVEFSQKCWLSLSLPQFFKAKDVMYLQKSGFKSVKIYPKGSKVYNIAKNKTIKAKYVLVEGELKDTQKGEFNFELNAKALNSLKIYLRASLKESGKEEPYTLPINYSPEYKTDQQGFSVFEINLE